MLKKLERDAIRSDLAAVEALLSKRSQAEDPVGWMQFSYRKGLLERQLDELSSASTDRAAIALFFGGRPVFGSRGIHADFGAKAIENFQSIVSTRFAEREGVIARMGPIAGKDRSLMMLTDVARGSFGFVLEEASSGSALFPDENLKATVDEVADVIFKISGPDEDSFVEALDALDQRVLGNFASFFKLLDDAGATLKVVEEQREFILQRDGIERARQRTEGLQISEDEQFLDGVLFVLPHTKRFELHVTGQDTVKGNVQASLLKSLDEAGPDALARIIGRPVKIVARVKTSRSRNGVERKSYSLASVSAD